MKISNNNISDSANIINTNDIKNISKPIANKFVEDGDKKMSMSFKGLATIAKAIVKKKTPNAVNAIAKSSDDIAKTMLNKSSGVSMHAVQEYASLQASEAQQIAIQQKANLEKLISLTNQLKKG